MSPSGIVCEGIAELNRVNNFLRGEWESNYNIRPKGDVTKDWYRHKLELKEQKELRKAEVVFESQQVDIFAPKGAQNQSRSNSPKPSSSSSPSPPPPPTTTLDNSPSSRQKKASKFVPNFQYPIITQDMAYNENDVR